VHVSRIYRKLGIRSRTELASLAASDALEVAGTTV
jgi:DNA-binding NarL/FixJ family response regulator